MTRKGLLNVPIFILICGTSIVEYHPGENRTIIGTEDGSTLIIKCGPSDAHFCELNNPMNKNTQSNDGPCELPLMPPRKEKHEGLWKCKFAVSGYAQALFATTMVYIKVPKTVDIGYNETTEEVNIFCNAVDGKKMSSFCRLTTPSGNNLYLSPGKGTQRYRFYGTKSYHCGVTIQKPLMDEEYGMWLCDLRSSQSRSTHYGGYVLITTNSASVTDGIRLSLKALPNYMYIQTSRQATITCQANASFEYCWFRDPRGNIYTPNNGDNGQLINDLSFGRCSYNIFSANSSHSGDWTCFAGVVYGSVRELTEKITVEVADIPFIAQPQLVYGTVGKSTTLLCKHPDKLLLKYCRFVRPDGVGFNLNQSKNDDTYIYAGRGLDKGECGLTIRSVQNVDFGKWTCTTLIYHNVDYRLGSLAATITLKAPEGMSLAWSIGITLGSLIAVSIVVFIAVVKLILPRWRKERNDQMALLNQNRFAEIRETPQPAFVSQPSFGTQTRRRSPRRVNALHVY